MSIQTSTKETINTLNAIFEKHKNERICVLATTCCGKTTLLSKISQCVDLDEELFPQLTKEEADFIDQKPWTNEIGNFFNRLVYDKISVKNGHPLFTTIIVDCDVVVYLDINDILLFQHCKKRVCNFTDAKKMKESIEEDWNYHRNIGKKMFYYLTITE